MAVLPPPEEAALPNLHHEDDVEVRLTMCVMPAVPAARADCACRCLQGLGIMACGQLQMK